MKRMINQAVGREPEPVWMSIVGAALAFLVPVVIAGACVACGWGS